MRGITAMRPASEGSFFPMAVQKRIIATLMIILIVVCNIFLSLHVFLGLEKNG